MEGIAANIEMASEGIDAVAPRVIQAGSMRMENR
jgi:hypothetical protein